MIPCAWQRSKLNGQRESARALRARENESRKREHRTGRDGEPQNSSSASDSIRSTLRNFTLEVHDHICFVSGQKIGNFGEKIKAS